MTFRDFIGPDACSIYMDYVGESEDWSMTVERSGESIHLDTSLLDDPSVHIEFNGDGHTLTAQEVRSSQLSSGETLVSHHDWYATHQG